MAELAVKDDRLAAATWKQTITGRAFPMARFSHVDIDLFGDVAQALARICRYGGHVPGNPYSVAQHCSIMADAAMEEVGDAGLAAHCLLHDAHEAYFGDMTTPVLRWLTSMEDELFGGNGTIGGVVGTIVETAKQRLDKAIWRAAGIPSPGFSWRAKVAEYDIRMLATEKQQLLMPAPKSWGAAVDRAAPIRLRGKLTAWPVGKSAEEYCKRLDQLCPGARRV